MSQPYRHILIATDFSKPAERALTLGVDLVQRFGARVTLLHAYDGGVFQRAVAPMHIGREELEQQMAATARTELERIAAARLGDAESVDCMPISSESPAQAIVGHAADHGVDLCIVGTHGRTGLSRMFAGSVAERVIRLASCDVLAVRDTPRQWPPKHILTATDFSDASQPAVVRAVQLGEVCSAEVTLAHVFDETVPIPLPNGTFESLVHARERLGAQLAEVAGAHSPPPKLAVLNGASPARELSAHAKSIDADLIVVGTHGRTGVAQVLIGSVAERIVRLAPAAALIVRGGQ